MYKRQVEPSESLVSSTMQFVPTTPVIHALDKVIVQVVIPPLKAFATPVSPSSRDIFLPFAWNTLAYVNFLVLPDPSVPAIAVGKPVSAVSSFTSNTKFAVPAL